MNFYTAALATASFLASQCPGGSAFVIGDAGLTNAIYQAGISMNNVDPDYVVLEKTSSSRSRRSHRRSDMCWQGRD